MSSEQNKALVRRFWENFNQGNDAQIDQFYAPDIVCYMGSSESVSGMELNRQMLAVFRSGFSNIRYTVQDMFAEDDRVVARLAWTMTHSGDFQGIPASGTTVTGSTIEIYRIAQGRIVEQWTESDNLSFMAQLGAISMPG
jgi:steroid delta-isomerase-like uncharacterized protein